jgi:hypothetical protein
LPDADAETIRGMHACPDIGGRHIAKGFGFSPECELTEAPCAAGVSVIN